MKKIFYILGLFLLLIPFKVNADTANVSMQSFTYGGRNITNFAMNDYWTYAQNVSFGGVSTPPAITNYQWTSVNGGYCNGAPSTISFSMNFPGKNISNAGYLITRDWLNFIQLTDADGRTNKCTYSLRTDTYDQIDVVCSAQNSSQLTILFQLAYYHSEMDNVYFDAGINRTFNFNCDRNSFAIQDATGTIVDNQNKNTNEIKESIGSMGSSINSSIGGMKEKQDETNDKLEEANQTSKGILEKIGDLLSSIIELPGKLVSLLIEGLKNLFVPTDEQLYEIINDSKDLAENFGFVGESMNFFITIFTSLLGMVNANGCVEFPEFTIGATSLTPSITFWTAHNVCLNDNPILSSNITTIRTITSIVLVALFINFAVSKFFSILNKNDSGTTYDVANDGTATITDWTRTNGVTTRVRR